MALVLTVIELTQVIVYLLPTFISFAMGWTSMVRPAIQKLSRVINVENRN